MLGYSSPEPNILPHHHNPQLQWHFLKICMAGYEGCVGPPSFLVGGEIKGIVEIPMLDYSKPVR